MGLPEAAARRPSISLIVPTYREVENLSRLIDQVEEVRTRQGLDLEMWIIDDDSRDGTDALIARMSHDWLHLVVRTRERGLSSAVLEGMRRARHDVLVVMDADLSHPPDKIPELVARLDAGDDFVLGSRYAAGGATDAKWGLLRWLNSQIATLLARPFTTARDPMAGFFALRRSTLEQADELTPIGYKIGLELIVKCRCEKVGEVPIFFTDRRQGQSKLTLAEQFRYLQHLRRLAMYKYPNFTCVAQFGLVGASGVLVNLFILTLCELLLGFAAQGAIAAGIVVSVVSNFYLNRRFTFSYARRRPVLPQLLGYVATCSVGLAVNYTMALAALAYLLPSGWQLSQLAALAGIAAGTIFDFVLSRYVVFRAPPVKPEEDSTAFPSPACLSAVSSSPTPGKLG